MVRESVGYRTDVGHIFKGEVGQWVGRIGLSGGFPAAIMKCES